MTAENQLVDGYNNGKVPPWEEAYSNWLEIGYHSCSQPVLPSQLNCDMQA